MLHGKDSKVPAAIEFVPPILVHIIEHASVTVSAHVDQGAPAEIVEEGGHLFLIRQQVVQDALPLENHNIFSVVDERVHQHHVARHGSNVISWLVRGLVSCWLVRCLVASMAYDLVIGEEVCQ